MSPRVCRHTAAVLFAAAVLAAVAGWWIAAGLAVSACMYFVGRYQGAGPLAVVRERERRLNAELARVHAACRYHLHDGPGRVAPATADLP
ncbi:hypothetical protein ABZY58_12145 [Micromonospora tulbaghiae]|uniref:hypothetical protein n=1 Tax=Micromonospora tulbaghiae TaxID=479978 RepID=UPI0033B66688